MNRDKEQDSNRNKQKKKKNRFLYFIRERSDKVALFKVVTREWRQH